MWECISSILQFAIASPTQQLCVKQPQQIRIPIMSVHNAKFALVAAGIALAALALLAQDVGYLDLTDPAPRGRIRSPKGGAGASVEVANPGEIQRLLSPWLV
jgi:hypothetical protein